MIKKELTLQKLDTVLIYLDSLQNPNSFREFYEMKDDLKKINPDYEEFELWIILDKLIKDEYVSTEVVYEKHINDNYIGDLKRHRFYITYEGKLFIQNKGYFKQQEDENKKSNKIEEEDKERRKHMTLMDEHQTKMARFQKYIVVATIVTGIYYFIELLKFFCHKIPCLFDLLNSLHVCK